MSLVAAGCSRPVGRVAPAADHHMHLPILVHIRTRQPNLGGKEAAVFIGRLLPAAQRDFPDANERPAERLRTIGLERVAFGSDWPGMMPAAAIDTIRRSLPLKPAEVDRTFTNRAPFLR